MSLISGIPPWVQMYFDLLMAKTGKNISEIFPRFSVFVYGGVNFEPYRQKLEKSIGKKIDSIETYPASEGFIAFQDSQADKALLLQVNNGIFYEFIPVDEFYNENPTRVSLAGVELNKNYVLILNTNAGLFGYNIGDTIKLVSIQPYKILVTGRLKHFISAFGEHVIGEEVEQAILKVAEKYQIEIIEFTVAPQVNPAQGLPYHEWFVEFAEETNLPSRFEEEVDALLCQKNTYYNDLIQGGILKKLHLNQLKLDGI
jgi:phenylacetate-coenzyme A ligase PaaK-like adenylate-forming protein